MRSRFRVVALPGLTLCLLATVPAAPRAATAVAAPLAPAAAPRYHHIVIDLLENHSFDSILGQYCAVRRSRVPTAQACNGVAIGTPVHLSNGVTVPLRAQPDIVPDLNHEPFAQDRAWHGGKDDAWQQVPGCSPNPPQSYACMQLVRETDIPAAAALADASVVADNTLTCGRVSSWADHFQWLSGCNLGGFRGDNPTRTTPGTSGPGWGCRGQVTSPWGPSNTPVPSCFPDYTLPAATYPFGGAYRATPVQPLHTLAEDCTATPGCTWRQYGSTTASWATGDKGFVWNLAATFAQLALRNRSNTVAADRFVTDATNGTLPSIAFLTPNVSAGKNSEHNLTSMAFGDAVFAQQFNALARGPLAQDTLFVLTYDDCGCFYDHVTPNRAPVIIAGAYVRRGGSDSTSTDFAGIIRMIDDTIGLPYQNSAVAAAYNFAGANDFTAPPHALPILPVRSVPPASMPYVGRDVPSRMDTDVS